MQRAGRRPLLVMSARWLTSRRFNDAAARIPSRERPRVQPQTRAQAAAAVPAVGVPADVGAAGAAEQAAAAAAAVREETAVPEAIAVAGATAVAPAGVAFAAAPAPAPPAAVRAAAREGGALVAAAFGSTGLAEIAAEGLPPPPPPPAGEVPAAPQPPWQQKQQHQHRYSVKGSHFHARPPAAGRGGAGGDDGGSDDDGAYCASKAMNESVAAVALLEAHRAEDPFVAAEAAFPMPEEGAGAGAAACVEIGAIAVDAREDSRAAPEIVARWHADQLVYAVPPGTNDDWFWLYATMHQQIALRALQQQAQRSQGAGGDAGGSPSVAEVAPAAGVPAETNPLAVAGGASSPMDTLPLLLHVAPADAAAPAVRQSSNVLVVSNDHMRDHHFRMRAPMRFLEWRERHQAHYRFDWLTGRRAVGPAYQLPRPYSHRIQHQLRQLPTSGSASEGSDCSSCSFRETWHMPLEGTVDRWLVAWRELRAADAAALVSDVAKSGPGTMRNA